MSVQRASTYTYGLRSSPTLSTNWLVSPDDSRQPRDQTEYSSPRRRCSSVRVPFVIRNRGGRKLIVAPGEAAATPDRPRVDKAMINAPSGGGSCWRKASMGPSRSWLRRGNQCFLRQPLTPDDAVSPRHCGGNPRRAALLRAVPSQIDGAVRVELGTPNVKFLRNVGGARSSMTLRLPLWPSTSTSPRLANVPA